VSDPNEVTALLIEMRNGDPNAGERLIPLVYAELRKLAASYMRREREGHTLQATALVHEAYLRLVDQREGYQNRSHFFGVAAKLMRNILVDHARSVQAAKRGAGAKKVSLEESVVLGASGQASDVVAIDDALKSLAAVDPQQSRIVELRFFGGLSIEQTAEVLGISPATVKRDWSMAKAWLYQELAKGT
jgi:RNA polymerase sigma factor (TIGR02999 family)